jgi:hypothetical protein
MFSPAATEFYATLRQSPQLWEDIASQPDMDAQIARTQVLAAQAGFDITEDEIRTGFGQFDTALSHLVDTDTLSDDELALISAGMEVQCSMQKFV